MSVEAMAAVLHHSRAKGTALVVLLGIANHAGDGGAWPSVSTLAKYGRCSERRVQQLLGDLVGLGELAVHRQAGGTRELPDHKRPNRYDVLVGCPAWCDGSLSHRNRVVHRPDLVERSLPGMPDSPETVRVKGASPGEGGCTPPGEGGFTQTTHENPPPPPASVGTSPQRARAAALPADVVHRHAEAARAALRVDLGEDQAGTSSTDDESASA